jgi:glycogen operon protein
MHLTGGTLDVLNEQGEPIRDDTLLLLLNAYHEPVPFTLPAAPIEIIDGEVRVADAAEAWDLIVDTAAPEATGSFEPGTSYDLQGRTLALLRWESAATQEAASS